MGNYKFRFSFRFSHMLPNAWFYKLRDMSKKPKKTSRTKNSTPIPNPLDILPPRKSSRRCRIRQDQTIVSSDDVVNPRLPPIITKRSEDREGCSTNRLSSPGVRVRTRVGIGGKRGRRTEMIMKKSGDPGREFRESMVEMIVENDIRAGKDMEELLKCYLLLNSDEYHQLIVDVFKQIWLDAAAVTIAAS